MGRRLLLINAVILVGIYLLARQVTASWSDYGAENNITNIFKQVKPPKDIEEVVPPSPPEDPRPYGEFTVIPEKDLFMPERRPAPPPSLQVEEPQPKLPRNPSLNGVLNNEGRRQALITIFEQPNAPKGQSRMVSVGDNVQGYTVTEITETTLTMKWKEHEIVLDMFDATPQPRPGPSGQRAAVVTIVTIGSPSPAVETSSPSESAGGPEAGPSGGAQPGSPTRTGGQAGRMSTAPGRNAEERVNPADMPATLGVPGGAVPFTSRTRRDNR